MASSELAQASRLDGLFDRVALEAARQCHAYVRGVLAVETLLFDFDGRMLGRAAVPPEGR